MRISIMYAREMAKRVKDAIEKETPERIFSKLWEDVDEIGDAILLYDTIAKRLSYNCCLTAIYVELDYRYIEVCRLKAYVNGIGSDLSDKELFTEEDFERIKTEFNGSKEDYWEFLDVSDGHSQKYYEAYFRRFMKNWDRIVKELIDYIEFPEEQEERC